MTESAVSAPQRVTRARAFSPAVVPLRLRPLESNRRAAALVNFPVLVHALRSAALAHSNALSAEAREVLSGHTPSGAVSDGTHLAFLPLLVPGDAQRDLTAAGVAAVLPAGLRVLVRHEVVTCLRAVRVLRLGPLGRWLVTAEAPDGELWSQCGGLWVGDGAGASWWATVTPFVFDRHPKGHRPMAQARSAEASVKASCAAAGLPEPAEVRMSTAAFVPGVPPSHCFPPQCRKDGSARRHVHLAVRFAEPVRGPVLIGAGRYRGWGCLGVWGERQ